jgi:predicted lipoprotein with Yx(FWY)xxD motif
MRLSLKKVLVSAACVTGLFLSATLALAGSVKVQDKEGLGKYLTDEKGMTLYIFKKDSPGKSICAGPCLEKWPLFLMEEVAVPDDLKGSDFAVITREDGKKQTTYKGLPLYYFFKDSKPGDMNGQGVNGIWFVAVP